jgi:hypothetical protein
MWDLYNRGEGTVAIKSTVGRLSEVVQTRKQMSCIGDVEYIHRPTHAETEVGQSIVFRKDHSYSFENEVRAVILDPNQWGYHKGLNMTGEPAERLEERIRQLYHGSRALPRQNLKLQNSPAYWTSFSVPLQIILAWTRESR